MLILHGPTAEMGFKMDWPLPSSLIRITHREVFEWDTLALLLGSAHERLAHSAADAKREPDHYSQRQPTNNPLADNVCYCLLLALFAFTQMACAFFVIVNYGS